MLEDQLRTKNKNKMYKQATVDSKVTTVPDYFSIICFFRNLENGPEHAPSCGCLFDQLRPFCCDRSCGCCGYFYKEQLLKGVLAATAAAAAHFSRNSGYGLEEKKTLGKKGIKKGKFQK